MARGAEVRQGTHSGKTLDGKDSRVGEHVAGVGQSVFLPSLPKPIHPFRHGAVEVDKVAFHNEMDCAGCSAQRSDMFSRKTARNALCDVQTTNHSMQAWSLLRMSGLNARIS